MSELQKPINSSSLTLKQANRKLDLKGHTDCGHGGQGLKNIRFWNLFPKSKIWPSIGKLP
jgi:hypothetical protein